MRTNIRLTAALFTFITFVTKAQIPNGFVDQVRSGNWQNPTRLTFETNGEMYVWEKYMPL